MSDREGISDSRRANMDKDMSRWIEYEQSEQLEQSENLAALTTEALKIFAWKTTAIISVAVNVLVLVIVIYTERQQ